MQLASVRIVVTDREAAARVYGDEYPMVIVEHWGGNLLHARDPSDNTVTFLQAK